MGRLNYGGRTPRQRMTPRTMRALAIYVRLLDAIDTGDKPRIRVLSRRLTAFLDSAARGELDAYYAGALDARRKRG